MDSRLTAMDVERQEFPRKIRGYSPEEVRLFLRAVAEEFERLNLENSTLREESSSLKNRVEEFRERERMLQETLLTAQRMAGDLKDKTRSEADLMVKEARLKAERLLEQAQDQVQDIEADIGRLKLERDAFENRLRALVEEHLALLDLHKNETADLENLRFLRRRGTEVG